MRSKNRYRGAIQLTLSAMASSIVYCDMRGVTSNHEKTFYGTITGKEGGTISGERITQAYQEVTVGSFTQNNDYVAEIYTDLSFHVHEFFYTMPTNSMIAKMAIASAATITMATLFILHGILANVWMEIAGGVTLLLTVACGVWELR